MTAANKWDQLYELEFMDEDRLHNWHDLARAEQDLSLFVEDWLRRLFDKALEVGDNGAVAYLLEAGVPLAGMPLDPMHSWDTCNRIAYAVDGNNWPLARLFRRNGAAMNVIAGQRVLMATERAALQ